jgi:hypothetical protein
VSRTHYDKRPRRARALSGGDKRVYLTYSLPRVQCVQCGGVQTKFGVRGSEFRVKEHWTLNPELRTRNPELRTRNPELRTRKALRLLFQANKRLNSAGYRLEAGGWRVVFFLQPPVSSL